MGDTQRGKWRQIAAGIAASIGSATEGIAAPFPSAAFPLIQSPISRFKASQQQLSLAAGAMMFGAGIGCSISGKLMDKYGRRNMLLFSSPFMICGFGLIAASVNPEMMIAARFIIGFFAGITVPTGAVYASETAERTMRGTTGSFLNVLFSLANFLAYILGMAFEDWRLMSWVSMLVPSLFFLLLLFMPASPRYLLTKGKDLQALKSLCWLRGAEIGDDVVLELRNIRNHLYHTPVSEGLCASISRNRAILSRCLFMGALFGSCGGSIVIAFAEPLLLDVQTPMHAEDLAVVAGAILAVGSIMTIFLMDKVGRIRLLQVSGALMSLSWFSLAAASFFSDRIPRVAGHLCTFQILLVVLSFSIGYRTVPTVLVSESLPFEVRGIGTSITILVTSLCISTFCFSFLYMITYLKVYGTALVFGFICLIAFGFPTVFFKETMGVSLEQLETENLVTENHNRSYDAI